MDQVVQYSIIELPASLTGSSPLSIEHFGKLKDCDRVTLRVMYSFTIVKSDNCCYLLCASYL